MYKKKSPELISNAQTTIVKEKEKKKRDRELLLIMLMYKSSRKTTGSSLRKRSRMQRRVNTRLSLNIVTKISTLVQQIRTEKEGEKKNIFFPTICFNMYVYIHCIEVITCQKKCL